ncbi:zf-HC2 domain-containing protein [candidate division KSB1 bacterium]|nr:zf-HC2 domain-containing protein [candidate division KSB1 bacterium]
MSCENYEKLIFLYRPGELLPEKIKKLKEHLETCRKCADLAEKVKAFRDIDKSDTTIDFSNAELLHRQILHRARMNSMPVRSRSEWLVFPKVRLALGTVIAFFVCLFFIQEFYIMMNIVRLEEKVSDYKQSVFFPSVLKDKILLSSVLEKTGVETPDDYIMVKKSTLRKLFMVYEKANITNRQLFEYIESQSELHDIRLRDGLNVKELEILNQNKHDILKYYNNL